MADTYSVELPPDYVPKFPDRCVVCQQPSPDGLTNFFTMTITWKVWLAWVSWLFAVSSPNQIAAPACGKCGWQLHARRWFELLALVALALAYVQWVRPLIAPHLSPSLRRPALVLIAFVLVGGIFVIWRTLVPPSFDVTVTKSHIDYEFNDLTAALRFFVSNRHAPWVRMGGHEGGDGELTDPIRFLCVFHGVELPQTASSPEDVADEKES